MRAISMSSLRKTTTTTATITIAGSPYQFVATGEVVKFDGFLRVYRETQEEEVDQPQGNLPQMNVGEQLSRKEITATQRFAQRPPRYNEASLVKKLEELGIGRPSTYATTITTIQNREYVVKGDKPGETQPYTILTLKGDKIKESEKKVTTGAERGKLMPTDTGIVVNDFLYEHFPAIMDYNFTADVEKSFESTIGDIKNCQLRGRDGNCSVENMLFCKSMPTIFWSSATVPCSTNWSGSPRRLITGV